VKKKEEKEEKFSSKTLMLSVLRNKYIWLLSLAYFFVYFIRTGIGDWTMVFMMESKGYTSIGAGGIASLFDIGGFLGGFSAGWLSDYAFKAKRGPVNALFALLLFVSICSFWFIPGGYAWMDSCMIFMMGFATFGPQMLIGVAVAEFAHKKTTATATGLAGWIAYLGSAIAGYPLGKVLDYLGWEGFFTCMAISASCAVVLLVPLWNTTKSSVQSKLKSPLKEEEAVT
ncbi:MAG: MFS transporter, partial [Verrucomicrobia bacterium]|nr:MFS transporter [Verrucomicrobiota bacterium]